MRHRRLTVTLLAGAVVAGHAALLAAVGPTTLRWQPPRAATIEARQVVSPRPDAQVSSALEPAGPPPPPPPPSPARPAVPTPQPTGPRQAAPPTAVPLALLPGYLSHADVERGALPRSAPDTEPLAQVSSSGLPIRLRVYISPSGEVRAVQVLSAIDDDAEMVARLEEMLRATAFAPARLGGRDVPSYLDLEFAIGPVGG